MLAVVLTLLAPSVAAPALATADDPGGLVVAVRTADNEQGAGRPNYAYSVEAGAEIEDAFVIENRGDVAASFTVTVADGYTSAEGRLELHTADATPESIGAWTDVGESELDLMPGESRAVPFTITVPEGVAAGDYTGGILAVHRSEGGATVDVDRRFGLRIHLRVAGEQRVEMELSDLEVSVRPSWNPFAPGRAEVAYRLLNEGTLRTVAHERLTASGPGGVAASTGGDLVEEVLPGSQIERQVEVPGVWPLLRTSVEVQLVPEAIDGHLAEPIHRSVTVWVIPWSLLAVLLALAGAGVLGTRLSRRRPPAAPETD